MHVSVAGKSRRSEHTLQFYYIALDLPFKTYLFSKSDIKHPPPKHMYFLDKYLNIYIYPLSAVYVLIMSRNSKITMQIFFFSILKLLLLLFSCWTLCTLIFIISLGAHFCDNSHSTYPMVPICLFVWHVTWISFPNFFLLRICQWLESEAVVLLGCCGFRVSTTSCSRVTLQYLGQKGSPGTCCSGLGWGRRGWMLVQRLFWGALRTSLPYVCCGISKAQKLL